jgi:nicotinamidase-related amidase
MEGNSLKQVALLIVDMQNDFVRRGVPLEVPDARNTIAPHRALLQAFRHRGWPVVYTRFLSRQEPNLLWNWSPQCRPRTKCCWHGHRRRYVDAAEELECAEVIDELAPESAEVIV